MIRHDQEVERPAELGALAAGGGACTVVRPDIEGVLPVSRLPRVPVDVLLPGDDAARLLELLEAPDSY